MEYTITPLLTGVRNPDQGIMTYQQGYGKRIWLPIWVFLVKNDSHTILVDTGLDENELITPAGFSEETGLTPMSLVECLATQGLTVDDVEVVINTHLHDDHCGNNGLLKQATFFAHPVEIAFCQDPHPIDHRYDSYFIEETEFRPVSDGDEVLPGITALWSPGHTMGCLSIQVASVEGPAVITGFCCNNENFPANGPAVCPGVHLDAVAAWESIQKIKALDCIILPMHELSLKKIG